MHHTLELLKIQLSVITGLCLLLKGLSLLLKGLGLLLKGLRLLQEVLEEQIRGLQDQPTKSSKSRLPNLPSAAHHEEQSAAQISFRVVHTDNNTAAAVTSLPCLLRRPPRPE